MERKIVFSANEFYHLLNRGTDKRKIFLEHKDYLRFIILLFVCNGSKPVNLRDQFPKGLSFGDVVSIDKGETLLDIGAYCLMPNHFHLFVRGKTEKGISKFAEKLLTGYSMYFNKKYGRTGRLFEGTFKASHVNGDQYLKYLFAYIHLNPIKLINPEWREKGIVNIEKSKKFLEKYSYSSYFDYIGKDREEKIILEKGAFPEYFSNIKDFTDFMDIWLSTKGNPLE